MRARPSKVRNKALVSEKRSTLTCHLRVFRHDISIDLVEFFGLFTIQCDQTNGANLTIWKEFENRDLVKTSTLHLAMISLIMSPAFFIACGLIMAHVAPVAVVHVDSILFENSSVYLYLQFVLHNIRIKSLTCLLLSAWRRPWPVVSGRLSCETFRAIVNPSLGWRWRLIVRWRARFVVDRTVSLTSDLLPVTKSTLRCYFIRSTHF